MDLLMYLLLAVLVFMIFFLRKPLINMAKKIVNSFLKISFAVFWVFYIEYYNMLMHSKKKELFKTLADHLNRVEGDIVEIGIGTGGNFEFYPDGCSVVGVDRNEYIERFLHRTKRFYPNIALKRYIVGSAEEDMRAIEDNSVSAVVTTLVLCSVGSEKKVMCEIMRILKPGGRLYFMEHVAGKGWMLTFQRWNDVFWPYIADGCYLTRRTDDLIKKSGFKNIKCTRFDANIWYPPIKHHVMGYAEV